MKTQAMKVTSCFQPNKVSETLQKSLLENIIIKMIALEHEINKDIDDLIHLKLELSNYIKDRRVWDLI